MLVSVLTNSLKKAHKLGLMMKKKKLRNTDHGK